MLLCCGFVTFPYEQEVSLAINAIITTFIKRNLLPNTVFLQVYNRPDKAYQLESWTGSHQNVKRTSLDNFVYIQFMPNFNNYGTGFRIELSTE